MYLLILILVPFLYLFNSYLALGALIAAIIAMYVERTRPSKPSRPESSSESVYQPGYKD